MSITQESLIIIGAGQSGLASASAARQRGLRPLVLEAGDRPGGSWAEYYDSLALFSPARFSGMPGHPFPGDPDHYPLRDEVVDYLRRYADGLDVEIRTGTRVQSVTAGDDGIMLTTADGEGFRTDGLIAASGAFANPYIPDLAGRATFTGRLIHAANYRNPAPFAGQRVVVVGAGNSAVQIGVELARHASVTLATRSPLQFVDQRPGGADIHHWLTSSGFDDLPPEWLAQLVTNTLVLDPGRYSAAFAEGLLDRRPMFDRLDGEAIVWSDGSREKVDTIITATGYRPALDYLEPLSTIVAGLPRHAGGISTTYPGLGYVGLEFQRSFASNTLRGVHRDAEHVVAAVAAHLNTAQAAVGF